MSLHMFGAQWLEGDDPVAEIRPEMKFPRQGFPGFHGILMEIDAQPKVFRSMLDHYPDLYDTENRPWGINDPEDAAFRWAGIPEGQEDEVLPPAPPVRKTSEKPDEVPTPDFVGGGGHGGHHGGHHGGGGFRGGGGWGWGGPWYDVAPYYEIIDEDDLDADAIAELVADKLAKKAFAAKGTTTVGVEGGWDLNRGVVAGWLFQAEVSNSKDPGVVQIREWYDSALKAHASTAPTAKSQAEVMMSMLAQKLSGAIVKQGTAGGAIDVARQVVIDAKKNLPELPSSFWDLIPWWAFAIGGVVVLGAGVYFFTPLIIGLAKRR